MYSFLAGIIATASFITGIFFLRFWKSTSDRFFLLFALAFWMMTLDRIVLVAFNNSNEYSYSLYLIRLLSFVLILIAIIDKNRAGTKS
jgi:hypothetical protein